MKKNTTAAQTSSVGRQARLQASAEPYGDAKRKRGQRSQPKASTSQAKASASQTSAAAVPIPAPTPHPGNGAVPYRDLCTRTSRNIHPHVKPRSDFELCCLAERAYEGSVEEIYARLDKQYANYIAIDGKEETDRLTAKILNTYMEPTGIKPRPGEQSPRIIIRPIPDTQYSLRLFPGSLTSSEYCLDFVDNETGAPVNSAFEFELWAVPDWDNPLAGLPIVQKMRSIENAHNIDTKDIRPGQEKFILRDGQTCVLARPGKMKIRFEVPIRPRPASETVQEEQMLVLDIPKFVD
ncbi:hypothetical protein C2E23DRAFT_887643 [Lenzites betulinus]|nr:hypothetical protein C2E23DRAFT_887643 [Lenzites betulinus]